MKLLLLWLTFIFVKIDAQKSYRGYEVYTTIPIWRDVMGVLDKFVRDPHFDMWDTPHEGQPVRVLTHSKHTQEAVGKLSFLGLEPTISVTNIQELIDEFIEKHDRTDNLTKGEVTFERYMELQEILDYLDEVSTRNSDVISIIDLGKTNEGRPLKALRLASGFHGKKSMLLNCGFYGREWMSPSVCLAVIKQVLTDQNLLDLIDWYILPVSNPDGYHYSWTQDYFWRKTRNSNSKSDCVGSNPNRNFDLYWNLDNNTDACSETYPGSEPFSEPEVEGIAELITTLSDSENLLIYITVHTQGQMILYPMACSTDLVTNAVELQKAGEDAMAAILKTGNITYQVFPSGHILHPTFGTSEDYAYAIGVPYVFTLELPRIENGLYNPPQSMIKSTTSSMLSAVQTLVKHVTESYIVRIRDDL